MSKTYSRWKPDEVTYLQNNYSLVPASEIAAALGKNLQSVRNKASRLKLKSFTDITRMWRDEELEFLKNNYLDMTHQEIAEYLGRTKTAVDLKLSQLGLKKEKYTYNKMFFDQIDTEEKAYWLGFIYADGYVHVNPEKYQHEVGIQLQWRDREHLKKFNKALNGNISVNKRSRTNPFNGRPYYVCEIRLYSKRMVESLARYNLSNGKSYTISFPSDISSELVRHFIRGFFDGDGCICRDNKKRETVSFDFCCANKGFLEKIRSELYKHGVYSYIFREKAYSDFDMQHAEKIDGVFYKNTYRLYIKGVKNTVSMIEYLYGSNVTIYLDRKYQFAMDNYHKLAQRLPRHSETSDFLLH